MVNLTADQLRQVASQLLSGQYLKGMTAAVAHQVTVGAIPGLGAGMNDTYTASDNVDATHALNIRYVIPSNIQRLNSARLSFHLAAYSTYSNFSATGTSTESADHVHGTFAESGHSHNHGHSQVISAGAAGATMHTSVGLGQLVDSGLGGNANISNINADNTGSSGHNHGNSAGKSATHTHTVSGSTFSGVVEGVVAVGVTIAFDGVDQTSALGGPWSADVIELDLRAFIATTPGTYHTIALLPTALGRIEAHLRLGAYVDARLP